MAMERLIVEDYDAENRRLLERNGLDESPNSFSTLLYKRKLHLICIASILVFGLLICFSPNPSTDTDHLEGASQGIYNNVAHPPFIDMMIASSCSDGYRPLSLGNWPGTNMFCYNEGKFKTNTPKCSPLIQDIPPQTYTKWKGSSICAKTASSIDNKTTTTCPSGFIKCNKAMCVAGDTCPITNIELSSSPLENTTTTGSVITPFGNYLNYRRDQGKSPIGGLFLSFGQNTPCLDTKEYPLNNNYRVIKYPAEGCIRYGEFPGYQLVDQDTAYNAFATQTWSRLAMKLPEFNNTLASQQAYLSYVPRLELAEYSDCKSMNIKGLYDTSKRLNITLYSNGIILVLILVFFLVMLVLFFCNASSDKTSKIILAAGCFIIGLLAGVGWIVLSSEVRSMRASITDIKTISNLNCFVSSQPQQVVTDILTVFTSRDNIVSKWLFLLINCFVWFFVFAIGSCFSS